MHRVAFKMHLFPGFEKEYARRHNQIWPDVQQLLKQTGITDYSIFLDESTNTLFAVLKADNLQLLEELPQNEVIKRWWVYMKEVMEANPDNSPVNTPLKEVFYFP
jgi:L-rhamnose mutarotase